MPYSPINMGNAMLQGEQILNARAQRDPNSLKNQLLALKIRQAQNPTDSRFSGIDPTAEMKNFAFRKKIVQDMKQAGKSEKEIIQALQRFDDSVSKGWYGKIGNVPSYVQAGGTPQSLGTLEGEAAGQAAVKGAGSYATEEAKMRAQAGLPPRGVTAPSLAIGSGLSPDIGGGGETPTAAELAGQKSKAQAEATAGVKEEVTKRGNLKAWDAYSVGMNNLAEKLGDTITGPIAGWLPPVTAAQQTAQGAQAVMAPLLKQLFRSAGEGTFTDRDQALLMEMVPTRKDHPEAAAAKIQMINQIVAAKLGIDSPAKSQSNDIDMNEYEERKKRLLGG